MSKDVLKKISIEVTHECWKKLKIISIEKDLSLQDLVRNMLERATNSKKFSNQEVEVQT